MHWPNKGMSLFGDGALHKLRRAQREILQAGIVSLDLSKSKEQDELKDWAELGFLKVMEKESQPK